ncbi:MAG: transcriptional regulator [Trichodesmium sp. MAG_R04]|nr:transcriptional regulator [Trichodesmium sp. MAG_R04]
MKQEKFELISAYLDGEVTPLQRKEVEALLETDPVARHLYQRLLKLHSKFQKIPITSTLEPVNQTIKRILEKVEGRSRRNFVLVSSAVTGLCIAVISGFISITRFPIVKLANIPDSQAVQIALNEPVIEIVNPNNVILTVNEPLLQIPQPTIKPIKN